MPSVTQVSRPARLTAPTISSTRSNDGPSCTSRQAAPRQKRSAPFAFASRAADATASTGSSGSASTAVRKWADCGQ